jgi:hypothetical protein
MPLYNLEQAAVGRAPAETCLHANKKRLMGSHRPGSHLIALLLLLLLLCCCCCRCCRADGLGTRSYILMAGNGDFTTPEYIIPSNVNCASGCVLQSVSGDKGRPCTAVCTASCSAVCASFEPGLT